jgi:ATP-dependent HslUV protease subunit HslV
MYAGFDKVETARELAELGVRAGCEFDKNSRGPIHAHTVKLKVKG